ncbi:programmed cell death protein 10-B-like [Bolinopsis microptera]|uniref:programmed cell death protein 10-B-like n=1 Tax=Bolinopsis microptera TaxID=2820187 RepID=UPI0030796D72
MSSSEPPPSLAFSTVIAPLLSTFSKEQSKSMREAFVFAEKQNPGFLHDFVAGVIQNEDMTEILLRLGSTECTEYLISPNIELHAQLNRKAQSLRMLLSSIPDQIKERSVFLQTIKDIAQSIKDLLNCVNNFYQSNTNNPAVMQNKRLFDHHKKNFVRCSKAFSDSLRNFFKDNQPSIVFLSANKLITQTNVLMRTIKIITEKG